MRGLRDCGRREMVTGAEMLFNRYPAPRIFDSAIEGISQPIKLARSRRVKG